MSVKFTYKKLSTGGPLKGRVYGKTSTIGLGENLFDELTLFLAEQFPDEVERAVFSVAYFAQQNMKKDWKRYAPSTGRPSLLQEKRWFDKAGKGSGSLKEKPYYGAPSSSNRDLGKAFQYKKFKGRGKAVVGWISRTAASSGDLWQSGGRKTVTAADALQYEAAAKRAGTKWEYRSTGAQIRKAGGRSRKSSFRRLPNGNIVPRVGAVIQHKRGGRKTPFIPQFFAKYESALTGALRRKIEEKLKLAPRGGYDVQIQANFDSVAQGFKVTAAKYTQEAINLLIAKQLGMFA